MDKKLEDAIIHSGNNLHLQVVSYLEENGWEVDLSSYYLDDTTNKPREIDIIAKKRIALGIESHPEDFNVILFIECKRFNEEIAFRTHKNNPNDSIQAVITEGIDKQEYFKDYPNQHHYLFLDKIAKLYDVVKKNPDMEKDDVFRGITQPVKSLVFFKDSVPLRGLYYPICVFNGIDGVYAIRSNSDDLKNLQKLALQQSITVGIKYSYKSQLSKFSKTKYFCVDFIHFNKLDEYMNKIIKQEADNIKSHLIKRINQGEKNTQIF